VDVAGGVEAEPGRKDPVKMRRFIAEVRANEPQEQDRPAGSPFDWMED
jgi:hypothetical protein